MKFLIESSFGIKWSSSLSILLFEFPHVWVIFGFWILLNSIMQLQLLMLFLEHSNLCEVPYIWVVLVFEFLRNSLMQSMHSSSYLSGFGFWISSELINAIYAQFLIFECFSCRIPGLISPSSSYFSFPSLKEFGLTLSWIMVWNHLPP